MKPPELTDENDKPRKLFGQRVEWPIAMLFATIPLLALIAVVKNVLLGIGA